MGRESKAPLINGSLDGMPTLRADSRMKQALMEPRTWVVGLGRTGTKSLCKAAEILGYQNVKHNPPCFDDLRDADFAAEAGCQVYLEYLDGRFPESRFVLTTRDLQPWLDSCRRAIETLYPMSRLEPGSVYYDAMIRNRMARYGTLDYDERSLIETYYRHHHRVLSQFKGRPDKLLIMNVTRGDGWEKLCPFLRLSVPDVPFPRVAEGGA